MAYRDNIEAAFSAWQLAIREKFGKPHPSSQSFYDLAKQYGEATTSEACLAEVGEWFDWDKIGEYMSRQPGIPDAEYRKERP